MVTNDPREAFSKRLNDALDEIGFATKGAGRQVALAKKLGITQKGARKWLESEGFPTNSRMRDLARLLGVRFEWLAFGQRPERSGDKDDVEPAGTLLNLHRSPIVGEVLGGTNGFLDEFSLEDAVSAGYVLHPTRDVNTYSLKVRGDSMRPRFKPGEYLAIEPSVQAQVGDDVVVQLKDGRKMLKELLMIRVDEMEFGSVNDGGRLTLRVAEIESIHRVAGHYPRGSSFVR